MHQKRLQWAVKTFNLLLRPYRKSRYVPKHHSSITIKSVCFHHRRSYTTPSSLNPSFREHGRGFLSVSFLPSYSLSPMSGRGLLSHLVVSSSNLYQREEAGTTSTCVGTTGSPLIFTSIDVGLSRPQPEHATIDTDNFVFSSVA